MTKAGKKRRGKKASAKAKVEDAETEDDDDYEIEESKKSSVADLLMSKAKGAKKEESAKAEVVAEVEIPPAPEPLKAGPWEPFFDFTERVFTEVDKVTRVGVKVDVEAGKPPGSSARVRVETDLPGDLLLHWGVVPRGARPICGPFPLPPCAPRVPRCTATARFSPP